MVVFFFFLFRKMLRELIDGSVNVEMWEAAMRVSRSLGGN